MWCVYSHSDVEHDSSLFKSLTLSLTCSYLTRLHLQCRTGSDIGGVDLIYTQNKVRQHCNIYYSNRIVLLLTYILCVKKVLLPFDAQTIEVFVYFKILQVFEDDFLSQAPDSGCPSESVLEDEGALDKAHLDPPALLEPPEGKTSTVKLQV